MKIVKNHGQSVEDETYEYMIVPGKTDQEMMQLAESIPYQVISNTNSIQAIQHQNLLMANVWESNQEIEGMIIETPMSLIVDEQENKEYEITMSNPAHGNRNLVLSFEREIKQVIEQGEEFSVDGNTITLNTNELQGASRTITIELEEETDKTELRELVEAHADKQEEDYTTNSWEMFTEALSHAEVVLEDDEATQEEVDEAVVVLKEAIAGLVELEEDPDPVDFAELEALVKEAETYDAVVYTEESYADLVVALKTAKAILVDEEATQAEVDQALESLQTAIDQLEEKEEEVNKSFLIALVEVVETLDESDYTEESYADLVAALEAGRAILADDEATQEDVDQAVVALQEAIEQLEQIDPEAVDKSKLKALVALHVNKQEEDYTTDSWEVFAEALGNAESVLTDDEATQEEVNQALETLQTALDQLEEKADKSVLIDLIEEAEELDESDYTEESYADLVEALEAAKAILANEEATQAEVDQVLESLQTALDQLEEKEEEVNKSSLIALVESVEELDESDYTKETYDNLAEALEAAQTILADDEATQAEVDQALENLQTALDQLEKKEVDRIALVDLVEEAEKLDGADYTEESYAELIGALEVAQTILADEEATQAEVDQALENLQTALDQLEEKEVDKSALGALVEEAEKLDGADYTEESYAELIGALEVARTILADAEATQVEVDAALVALEQAIEGLETVQPDSGSNPEGPENPRPTDPTDPAPTDPEDKSPVVDKGADGDSLPATATSTYNWLFIGFTLLLASGLILLVTNRKKKSAE